MMLRTYAAAIAGERIRELDGLTTVTGAETDVPTFPEGAGLGRGTYMRGFTGVGRDGIGVGGGRKPGVQLFVNKYWECQP